MKFIVFTIFRTKTENIYVLFLIKTAKKAYVIFQPFFKLKQYSLSGTANIIFPVSEEIRLYSLYNGVTSSWPPPPPPPNLQDNGQVSGVSGARIHVLIDYS